MTSAAGDCGLWEGTCQIFVQTRCMGIDSCPYGLGFRGWIVVLGQEGFVLLLGEAVRSM